MEKLSNLIPKNPTKKVLVLNKKEIPSNFTKNLHKAFVESANEILEHRGLKFDVSDPKHSKLYGTLIRYFARDDEFFNSDLLKNKSKKTGMGPSFDKGILLLGNSGIGKSFIFWTLSDMNKKNRMLNITGNNFSAISAHEVVGDYDGGGSDAIKNMFIGQRYFDDLGSEEKGSYYKTSEVFRVLMERRHTLFTTKGVKTFLTSNSSRDELLDRYGSRVESRLYEMFNIIVADGPDRRKM